MRKLINSKPLNWEFRNPIFPRPECPSLCRSAEPWSVTLHPSDEHLQSPSHVCVDLLWSKWRQTGVCFSVSRDFNYMSIVLVLNFLRINQNQISLYINQLEYRAIKWMRTDGLVCCVLLWCFYQTLILTAPIHCRASIDETLTNLMKKQTHPNLRWTEGEYFLILGEL